MGMFICTRKCHLRSAISLGSGDVDGIIPNSDIEKGNICYKYILLTKTKGCYIPFSSKQHLDQKKSMRKHLLKNKNV